MTATEKISEFRSGDTQKLAEIVENHPFQIPVPVIADWWHCSEDSVRNALKQQGFLGIAQKQPGKVNTGFVVPTGHFVRWYVCKWGL